MPKNMAKTIHEAPKFSRLRCALAFSGPWFFHESLKLVNSIPVKHLRWNCYQKYLTNESS